MQPNKDFILSTSNLSIGYTTKKRRTIVAKNINLDINEGELIGLVGANGVGKSTLLRTLSNLQKPLSGSISLKGKSIKDYLPIEMAKAMSLVLTEQLMSKNLTVFELIAIGRQPYTNWIGKLSKEDQIAVGRAIELTNIEQLQQKKCYELSDGQMQKVLIARALAQDTEIIILDEPTTHLDLYHKAYILKLLQKLTKDTRKTILFSSHEIDLTIQLCDTMAVMTEDKVYTNSPCKLIKNGVFESLFPKDLIDFDLTTGSFRFNK